MSRLVTSSPTSGSTIGVAGRTQQPGHRPPDDEQLLVLGGAETVQDHADPVRVIARRLGQHPLHQEGGQLGGRRQRRLRHPGLTVDAEADTHQPGRHLEQRMIGAGHRAAGERHAQGPGAVVRVPGDPLHLIEVVTVVGRSTSDLEHDEVTGDAAPPLDLLDRRGGDVVGHEHHPGVDALGDQPLLSQGEVHDVAGVVAGAEQQSAVGGRGLADRVGVLGRRGGEDVPDHRTVGEARADHSAEGRIVTGTAADDHGHLARRSLRGPDHTTGHAHHPVAVDVQEACQQILREAGGVVVEAGHPPIISSPSHGRRGAAGGVDGCAE